MQFYCLYMGHLQNLMGQLFLISRLDTCRSFLLQSAINNIEITQISSCQSFVYVYKRRKWFREKLPKSATCWDSFLPDDYPVLDGSGGTVTSDTSRPDSLFQIL